jgi:hypothetical protein
MIGIFRTFMARVEAFFQPAPLLRQRALRVTLTRNDRPHWMRQIKK